MEQKHVFTKYSSLCQHNCCSPNTTAATKSSEAISLKVVTILDTVSLTPRLLLECVLTDLFDNILVHLSESMKAAVLSELGVLVSMEGLQFSQCTKEQLLGVFQQAEVCHKDISLLILNRLVNLKGALFVSDAAIAYINRTFPGQVLILSTEENWQYQQSYRYSTSRTHSTSDSSCCDVDNIIQRNSDCQQTSTLNRAKTYKINKICVISVSVSIAITCVSIYGLSFILRDKLTNEVTSFTPNLSTTTSENVEVSSKSSHRPQSKREVTGSNHTISVQTYQDYLNAMAKISYGSQVELLISLQNSSDWPPNAELGNAHLITKLKLDGNLDISRIIIILKGMINLESLTITNTSQLFCQLDELISPGLRVTKIQLDNVKKLVFDGIDECPDFFQVFSINVVLKNLQIFKLESGSINHRNIVYIKSIWKAAAAKLHSIELLGTIISTTIFDNKLGRLANVHSLVLDINNNHKIDVIYFSQYIPDILPNLKSIQSHSGYLPWNQFLNLSGCKKLESITIGLLLPSHKNSVDFKEIRNNFSSLLEVDFIFSFESAATGCYIEGVQDVNAYFKYLMYIDNCHIFSSGKKE